MLQNVVQHFRRWNFYTTMERLSKEGKFRIPGLPMWTVQGQTDSAAFYNKEHAVQFAKKHGLQDPVQGTSVELIEPQTMRWLITQRAKAMDTGALYGRVMYAHPDNCNDMIDWFNQDPSSISAFWVLRMGLANNNPRAANAVAQWVAKNPDQWFSEATLVNKTDLPMDHSSQNEDVCLLGRLMMAPTVMQWLFDQELGLKHKTQDPTIWEPLLKHMYAFSTRPQLWRWPAIAHAVFKHEHSPLEFAYPHSKDVVKWMQTFSHSPAAVAYYAFSSRQDIGLWSVTHSPMPNHPDVLEFHQRLCAQNDPAYTRAPQQPNFNEANVQALMLGVHLDLSAKEFYYHAQKVLEPSSYDAAHKENLCTFYENLDASLF